MRPALEGDEKWLKTAITYKGDAIPEDFEEVLSAELEPYDEVAMLEDYNGSFASGFGPVGLLAGKTNGYMYEPHIEWFPWASPRNKFRATVMFLQKYRYRDIGIIVVHALEEAAPFFRRLKEYVPLFYVGKIPCGDELGRGDDYIFYLRCAKSYEQHIQENPRRRGRQIDADVRSDVGADRAPADLEDTRHITRH